LICGVGNPGRGDDGIGPALVSRLEKERKAEPGLKAGSELSVEIRLQLNVEDALTFSQFDRVVVVDASRSAEPPFSFTPLESAPGVSFSTHALSAGAVLAWCRTLYGKSPDAYILAVRGAAWELGEKLSREAEENFGRALEFLKEYLEGRPPQIDN